MQGELAQMGNLQAVLDWLGLADTATRTPKTSLWQVLGSPTLVRHLAAIPRDVWDTAIAAWQVDTVGQDGARVPSPPTPVEAGQVGTLRRVARLIMGLDPNEVGGIGTFAAVPGPQQAPQAGAPGPAAATAIADQERKVKLSLVMDQGDETEVKLLNPANIRTMIADWRELENDGEDPLEEEEEEATGDQLTALDYRLKQGAMPFVDFAVWRPFGARFGRLLKFVDYFPQPKEGFVTKEINGPVSFEEWKKSWRVFVFAMVVIGAASRSRLTKYELRIQKLHETYPKFWWIIGLADIRMRSEHLERIRRRLMMAAPAPVPGVVPARGAYDPAKPWDLVPGKQLERRIFGRSTSIARHFSSWLTCKRPCIWWTMVSGRWYKLPLRSVRPRL